MRKLTTIILACFLLINTKATTYYISNTGNDNANGTSEVTAWQTLDKALNNISSGDVILLKRGDIFRESADFVALGIENLTIDAYGSSSDPIPIISGGINISNWTLWKDNIYKASTTEDITSLTLNKQKMTLARYPNSGWILIDNGKNLGSETYIESKALGNHPNDADDYWNGAHFRWHRWSWFHEHKKINDYSAGGKLTLEGGIYMEDYFTIPGWAFYIDDKLEELDSITEWYQDPNTLEVYLRTPHNDDPDNYSIEGSYRNIGFTIKNSTVNNIAFTHQAFDAIQLEGSCTIENCTFEHIHNRAVHARAGANNCDISYNTFTDINNIGINWYAKNGGDNLIIEHNTFERIAMTPAHQNSTYSLSELDINEMVAWWPWNNFSSAIVVWYGSNIKIKHNYLDSIAGNGMGIHVNGTEIDSNSVHNSMLTLNDGAAIYINAEYCKCRSNIVTNCQGFFEHGSIGEKFAHGIWTEYLFDFENNIVENNTVADCGTSGIYLTNNYNASVKNNTCYNNGESQLRINGMASNNHTGRNVKLPQNNTVEDNILFAAKPSQMALKFEDDFDYGTVQNNLYAGLYDYFTVVDYKSRYYTAEQVSLYTNWEKGSATNKDNLPEYRSWNPGTELIENGDFEDPSLNWKNDELGAAAEISISDSQTKLDGNSLQIMTTGGAVLARYSSDMIFEKERFYEVKFDYVFSGLGNVDYDTERKAIFYIFDAKTGSMMARKNLATSTSKESVWAIFQAPNTTGEAIFRVSFTTSENKIMWIDNVSVKEVDAQNRLPELESQLVYNETPATKSFDIGDGNWHDVNGTSYSESVSLDPYTSIILIRDNNGQLSEVPQIDINPDDPYIPPLVKIEDNVFEDGSIQIFPNPASEYIMFSNAEQISSINIVDITGRRILNQSDLNGIEILNISNLSNGVYIVELQSINGECASKKIIKK